MASRWRQRRMCLIVADKPAPAAIRQISARGAFIETNERPALGSSIELRHPDAGSIHGRVCAVGLDGIDIAFACGPRSVAFALAAIGADMSRPAR